MLFVIWAASCTSSAPPIVGFLLDISLTVRNFQAAQTAWQQILAKAEDGETIVFAVVQGGPGDVNGGEFPYFVKVKMPIYSILGNRDDYEKERSNAVTRLTRAFDEAMKLHRPNKTLLLSSIRSMGKMFAARDGKRCLILATDGLEDSAAARFEDLKLTDEINQKLIDTVLTDDLRHQMQGVSVRVVTSGIPSEEKATQVERFWLTYFQTAGANFPSHYYAGQLMDF